MKFKESAKTIQFKNYKEQLNQNTLSSLFSAEAYMELLNRHCWDRHKHNLYNPLNTLLTFIQQMISADKTCQNAVAGMIAKEFILNKNTIGNSNSSYVKARQKLPADMLYELVKLVGVELSECIPAEWKVFGRPLKAFDGTTLTMADTPANRLLYPKHSNQRKNIGFPLARLVVVMCLATGTIIDYALGPCKGKGTGESALLRTMLDGFKPNDIVLADRYYPHFFMLWDLKKRRVDGVFRAAAQRHYDFRCGKRLGAYDHIAVWHKPRKPDWMSREEYNDYPDTLQIREFKASGFIYVTTLLDPKSYSKKELYLLYKRRWEAETNLKYIKAIMEMDHLLCKSPEMVEKEISVHFLAYNLIRNLMAKAAMKYQLTATQISFKATVQLLNQFTPLLNHLNSQDKTLFIEMLLHYISKNRVANRPGRAEPRAVRHRTKSYPVLKVDRTIQCQKTLQMAC